MRGKHFSGNSVKFISSGQIYLVSNPKIMQFLTQKFIFSIRNTQIRSRIEGGSGRRKRNLGEHAWRDRIPIPKTAHVAASEN